MLVRLGEVDPDDLAAVDVDRFKERLVQIPTTGWAGFDIGGLAVAERQQGRVEIGVDDIEVDSGGVDEPLPDGVLPVQAPVAEAAFELLVRGGNDEDRDRLGHRFQHVAGPLDVDVEDDVFPGGEPTGCTGTALALIAFDIGIDADLAEQLAFAPVASLAVVKDIAVDGGLTGSGELSSVSNLFRLPEPGSALLVAAGALALRLRCRSVST